MALTWLPGDMPEDIKQVRWLVQAGLLPLNTVSRFQLPCPRCTRLTGVCGQDYYDQVQPAVCTQCRAEWLGNHLSWTWVPADPESANSEIGDSLTRFLARLRKAKRKAGHDEN